MGSSIVRRFRSHRELQRLSGDRLPSHRASLEQIRELVAGVLGLKDIDAEVNLLEYGATSIDMIRIANRIDEVLGYRPRIGDFYRDPTVIGLARAYERQMNKTRDAARARISPTRQSSNRGSPGTRDLQKAIGLRQFHENVASYRSVILDDQTIGRYLARRSHREFSAVPFPKRRCAACWANLARSWKVVRSTCSGRREAPMACKPTSTRSPRVTSVPAGVYYYQPIERRLVLISGGACISSDFYDFLINRPVFEAAAFAMFFVAQLRAIEPLYGGMRFPLRQSRPV